jgi:hypothetical protein
MINLDLVRRKIMHELPARARWLVGGSPLDFDFSRAQRDLRPIGEADTNGFEIPQEWLTLYLFGEEDYAQGGGAAPYLGVHADTGQVFGLDVERDSSPIYLLNSDVDKYILTFDVFDQALRRGTLHVMQVARLAEEVDPVAFVAGEWHYLADAISSDEDFEVDPAE